MDLTRCIWHVTQMARIQNRVGAFFCEGLATQTQFRCRRPRAPAAELQVKMAPSKRDTH